MLTRYLLSQALDKYLSYTIYDAGGIKQMIKKEYYKTLEDRTVLIRTYSSRNHYIIQDGTGIEYLEAIDPEHMNRTYTESDRSAEDIVEER